MKRARNRGVKTKRTNANRKNKLINGNGLLPKYRRIERVAGCRRVASFRNYPGLSSATETTALLSKFGTSQGTGREGTEVRFFRASVSLFFSLCRLFGICFVPNDQSFPGPVMNSIRRTGRSFLATFLPRALSFGTVRPTDKSSTNAEHTHIRAR